MDTYLLVLYVTLDQETAIRNFFFRNGWCFEKKGTIPLSLEPFLPWDCLIKQEAVPETQDTADVDYTVELQDSDDGELQPNSMQKSTEKTEQPILKVFEKDEYHSTLQDESGNLFMARSAKVRARDLIRKDLGTKPSVSADLNFSPENKKTKSPKFRTEIIPKRPDRKGRLSAKPRKGSGVGKPSSRKNTDQTRQRRKSTPQKRIISDNATDSKPDNKPKEKKKYPRPPGRYECELCGKAYLYTDCVYRHLRSKHGISGHENFKLLKDSFTNREIKLGRWVCRICDKSYSDRQEFRKHLYQQEHRCLYQCAFCCKTFLSYLRYQEHKSSHRLKSRNETGNEEIELKNSEKMKRVPHHCLVCKKSCDSRALLFCHKKLHMSRFGSGPSRVGTKLLRFKCTLCSSRFTSTVLFRRHLQRHLSAEMLTHTCAICHKAFAASRQLVAHKKLHRNLLLKCEHKWCSVEVMSAFAMEQHLRKNKEVKKYQCSKCCRKFASNIYQGNHILRCRGLLMKDMEKVVASKSDTGTLLSSTRSGPLVNDNKEVSKTSQKTSSSQKLLCKYCGLGFPDKIEQFVHERRCPKKGQTSSVANSSEGQHSSSSPQMVKCEVCDRQFMSSLALTIHLRNHSETRHKCEECGKVCVTRSSMIVHMRNHLPKGERPKLLDPPYPRLLNNTSKEHKCEVCGKQYLRATSLKVHMQLHTGEKPYSCEYCGKSFRLKKTLAGHRNTHEPSKKVLCYICGSSFVSKESLDCHLKHQHNPVIRFFCEFCPYKTSRSNNYKMHMKMHNNDKNYQCEVCGYSTITPSSLYRHCKVLHSDERPFVCNICGKGFKLNSYLEDHLAIHRGDRKFECKLCNYRCTTKGYLRKHMNVHKKRDTAEGKQARGPGKPGRPSNSTKLPTRPVDMNLDQSYLYGSGSSQSTVPVMVPGVNASNYTYVYNMDGSRLYSL